MIYVGLIAIVGSFLFKWFMTSGTMETSSLTPAQIEELKETYLKKSQAAIEDAKIAVIAKRLVITQIEGQVVEQKYDMSAFLAQSPEAKLASEQLRELERLKPEAAEATGVDSAAAPMSIPSPTPTPTPTPAPAMSSDVARAGLVNGVTLSIRLTLKLDGSERLLFRNALGGRCLTTLGEKPVCASPISITPEIRREVLNCHKGQLKKIGLGCLDGDECWKPGQAGLALRPLDRLSFIVGKVEALDVDVQTCKRLEEQP